ncbi:MAG: 30S ribosomal protein S6 [Ktedonobacteraceae bacterium]
MSRDYELGFILNPEVNEEQTRTILEHIEQIVSKYGGQVMRVNQWGRRRLAYQIDHHRDGLYVFIDMVLTPETVSELDRTLKVSEEVIRHMIKKRDPKAVQKEREARAAAAAAAQAQPAAPPETEAEVSVEGEAEAPTGAENETPVVLSTEEQEAPMVVGGVEAQEAPMVVGGVEAQEAPVVVGGVEAQEAPVAQSAEEDAFVPPALEDEAVEA